MRLDHWRVDGYRSIGEAEFSPSQFNILIGRNNTGKSNIIKCLTEYAGHMTHNIDESNIFHSDIFDHRDDIRALFNEPDWESVITRNDEYSGVSVEFEFNLNDREKETIIEALRQNEVGEDYVEECRNTQAFSRIRHRLVWNRSERRVNGVVETIFPNNGWETVQNSLQGSSTYLRLNQIPPEDLNQSSSGDSISNIILHRLQKSLLNWRLASAFREPTTTMLGRRAEYLKSSGSNLVQVLDTMADNYPDQFRQVQETYVDIMEGVTGIRTPYVGDDQQRSIVIDEEGYSDGFNLDEISGGSKEILTLITKIVKAESEADVLLVEEPELHIHPNAQQAIYDLIKEVCSEGGPQVLLSTHSDVFVNRTDASNIIAVKRDIETQIEPIQDDVEGLLESLGYSKSEVLQSNAAVFVEGVSDQSVLKVFSETLSASEEYESVDELGVTVRPLGGDRMRRHGGELHDSLSHLRIPHFFLVDSDDKTPREKEEELKGDLQNAELRVLDEYCIESYLLKNPYAIANPFNLDENEVKEYIEDAEDRPNKKSVLDDLFKDLAGREGGYDEREHSWTIARNVRAEDIPPELIELIDRIQDLPNS